MPGGGRFSATNVPLREIIRVAYSVPDFVIVDAPGWTSSERFDIVAKADGAPERDELFQMLRSLLADRFKLAVRREKRELPQYTLVRARPDGPLGSRLRPSTVDCPALLSAAQKGTPIPKSSRILCGRQGRPGQMIVGGQTMDQIAEGFWGPLQRVVVNRTGIAGSFDLDLDYAPDASVPSDAPSIFTAVQEQLGLKLESTTGPVDVLVIAGVQRPTEE
jgi:uncharacterized protein (TIGR03435 family)